MDPGTCKRVTRVFLKGDRHAREPGRTRLGGLGVADRHAGRHRIAGGRANRSFERAALVGETTHSHGGWAVRRHDALDVRGAAAVARRDTAQSLVVVPREAALTFGQLAGLVT